MDRFDFDDVIATTALQSAVIQQKLAAKQALMAHDFLAKSLIKRLPATLQRHAKEGHLDVKLPWGWVLKATYRDHNYNSYNYDLTCRHPFYAHREWLDVLVSHIDAGWFDRLEDWLVAKTEKERDALNRELPGKCDIDSVEALWCIAQAKDYNTETE